MRWCNKKFFFYSWEITPTMLISFQYSPCLNHLFRCWISVLGKMNELVNLTPTNLRASLWYEISVADSVFGGAHSKRVLELEANSEACCTLAGCYGYSRFGPSIWQQPSCRQSIVTLASSRWQHLITLNSSVASLTINSGFEFIFHHCFYLLFSFSLLFPKLMGKSGDVKGDASSPSFLQKWPTWFSKKATEIKYNSNISCLWQPPVRGRSQALDYTPPLSFHCMSPILHCRFSVCSTILIILIWVCD